MSGEDESGEKEYEATARRLDQARTKGEIARSQDLPTAAAYAGLLVAAWALGEASLRRAGQVGAVLLDQADLLSRIFTTEGGAPFGGLLAAFALALAPFFLLPAMGVLVAVLAQRSLVFTPDKIMPKLSRISLVAGAKNKFGRSGLFEFAKSFVKLVIISVALGLFLVRQGDRILGTLHLTPALMTATLLQMVVEFLFLILLIATAIGGVDYLWQAAEHRRRHRMSRKEVMDEHKESEGDPQTKAQRRQRGYDIATNRMLADVATADVVIVNPTHYAVALKWNRAGGRAPVCVAKGVDEIAARIRERAAVAGVPLHRDPPTARALHAAVKIGQEVQPEHYRTVAAAIRFAEAMRRKARAWR
ncbi:flagellar type III secretion system protein FlhB [Paracoccaceae bacterium Fryx2]|nr:flagellar type III secretion system protein FlhB [Paracoccaceae bacterium Fryx2]